MALYKSTVSSLLLQALGTLMRSSELAHFRLGGGIALCLHHNHRKTNEIDLYTETPFSDVALRKINTFLVNTFGITEHSKFQAKGQGTAFFIYNLNQDYVKIELHFITPFIRPAATAEDVRFIAEEEIVAMKLDAIMHGGTKTDFWDLHYLMTKYSLTHMLALHKERYAETHDTEVILSQLKHFSRADDDFAPKCLLKKNWYLMKLDFLDLTASYQRETAGEA